MSINNRKRERPVQGAITEAVHRAGEQFLQGVQRDGAFNFSVRDSVHVHQRARAGDAVTILATALEPDSYPHFPQFMHAFFPSYEKIGTNALRQYTSLWYTVSSYVTLHKPGAPD